jgi:DtxR family transcriptional regulator, Mn-dependent transcriptional regulator
VTTSGDLACCELSASMEDYLKALLHLDAEGEPVTTTAVAHRVEVSPPSASAMLRRLRDADLVRTGQGHELGLTAHGRRHALRVVRRHRLVETFLAEVLDVPWDEVHAEAERLEHALSPALEERIATRLGDPSHDPHGDPIPPREGEHDEAWPDPLDAAPAGASFRVERVSDRDSDALRYLDELGVRPGVQLRVGERDPFGGPLWVEVAGEQRALGAPLARLVHGTVERSVGSRRGGEVDEASAG